MWRFLGPLAGLLVLLLQSSCKVAPHSAGYDFKAENRQMQSELYSKNFSSLVIGGKDIDLPIPPGSEVYVDYTVSNPDFASVVGNQFKILKRPDDSKDEEVYSLHYTLTHKKTKVKKTSSIEIRTYSLRHLVEYEVNYAGVEAHSGYINSVTGEPIWKRKNQVTAYNRSERLNFKAVEVKGHLALPVPYSYSTSDQEELKKLLKVEWPVEGSTNDPHPNVRFVENNEKAEITRP